MWHKGSESVRRGIVVGTSEGRDEAPVTVLCGQWEVGSCAEPLEWRVERGGYITLLRRDTSAIYSHNFIRNSKGRLAPLRRHESKLRGPAREKERVGADRIREGGPKLPVGEEDNYLRGFLQSIKRLDPG